jgi:hypothetical protein
MRSLILRRPPQAGVSEPHPEEPPQGRVSKDGRTHRTRRPSFETLASQAPQDEDVGAHHDFRPSWRGATFSCVASC